MEIAKIKRADVKEQRPEVLYFKYISPQKFRFSFTIQNKTLTTQEPGHRRRIGFSSRPRSVKKTH